MQFDPIPVHAVKSISQRNLAMHWQTLHATRGGLPAFANFSPGNRAHDPRQLLLWAVDDTGGERSYRPLYGGDYVYEAFGPGANRNSVPERLKEIFTTGMGTCVASTSIVYMSIATSDEAGHRVDGERLLLPFGNGGATVTHVLASLQLVSIEGNFQRNNVIQMFERESTVTFSGRILPVTPLAPRATPSRAQASRSAG